MYGYTSVLIMGEEKIRRNLGILPREKTKDINFPQLVKKVIKKLLGRLYINIR